MPEANPTSTASLKVRHEVHRTLSIIAAVRGEQIGILADEILSAWLEDPAHSIGAEMMRASSEKKEGA